MEDLVLYKSYSYNFLEAWFDGYFDLDPNSIWIEGDMQPGTVEEGLSYIAITNMHTYTFILDGYIRGGDNKGAQYKLIYKK